ncbi:hypothetical protein ACH0CG_09445 [Microbacterium sp. 179-I 1D1 NHS]|uniref:hypothetical protein n=1 Tax=Microbacterium sp. 179-I 1D1 NHS TaxID=3374298 RepID=UPI003879C168
MHDWNLDDDVPYLERPHEYAGQERVSIGMWPSAGNRTEQLAVLEEWIDFLRTPRPIVQLHLSGWSNDRMVRALSAQTNVLDLRIEWGRYSDLSVIGALRQLEILHIGWATSLTDLRPLMSLGRLHTLRVEGAARLRDFAPIGALTGLRDLQVGVATEGRTSVDSLEFVRHLRGLQSFSWTPGVAGNDYTPLLSMRDVDEIELREHRGMHPSMSDLEKALPGLARTRAAADVYDADGVDPSDRWEVDFGESEESDDSLRGPIAGTVFRTFTRTARTRSEHFWMQVTSPALDTQAPPPTERLLDRCAFAGDAAGPLLLWDTPLPRPARNDVDAWFAGNVDRWSPTPRPTPRDATALDPLPAEQFWPHLDLFKGRFDGVMVHYRFDRDLEARGEEFVLRWTQTLGLLSMRALPAARAIIASDRTLDGEELAVVGSLIGRGRDNYDAWLADPASWTRPPHLDMASSIVHLGQGVLRHRNESIAIITAFSDEIERARDADVMSGFFEETDEQYAAIITARAVVRVDGAPRERLVAFDISGIEDDLQEAAAEAALLSFGGSVVAGPELSRTLVGDSGFGRVFTVRRRSSTPDDEYIARYAGV